MLDAACGANTSFSHARQTGKINLTDTSGCTFRTMSEHLRRDQHYNYYGTYFDVLHIGCSRWKHFDVACFNTRRPFVSIDKFVALTTSAVPSSCAARMLTPLTPTRCTYTALPTIPGPTVTGTVIGVATGADTGAATGGVTGGVTGAVTGAATGAATGIAAGGVTGGVTGVAVGDGTGDGAPPSSPKI